MVSAWPRSWYGGGTVRAALVVAIGLIVWLHAARAAQGRPAASARIANYTIVATYDDHAHTVAGHETLRWLNTTREDAPDLYFHLYPNAFANSRSSFVREVGEGWGEYLDAHPHAWGYMTVDAIRIGGTDVTSRLQFVHPDDDNLDDRTVCRLPLETPVRPREGIEVEIDFTVKLPKLIARSGYAGPFAFVGQWFPKIGVYEDGSWNCHQYHRNTEFFADFGVYDVTLIVPRGGVVGATGVLRDQRDRGDGKQELHFVAEDVHDFAWTIDPRFRVVERSVAGTSVRLLVQPNHVDQGERYLQAVQTAIKQDQDWFGSYPYTQLTVVDPGPGGSRAGGMEYPTLITVGTAWWMPRGLRFPEAVTVHEFGHQYWYGMVANNEFENAWLDEGINSYVEGQIMDGAYGPGSYMDLFGLRCGSRPLLRLPYLLAAQHDPMVRYGWQFLDHHSYASISYAKTALVLDTLEGRVGAERLRAALRAYFERWRFRHPRGDDFVAALRKNLGDGVSQYLDQTVSSTEVLDYAVTEVNAAEAAEFAGYSMVQGHAKEEVTPPTPQERRYRSEVVVERLGGVRMPVDVQVVFDDHSSVLEHWDGQDRWKRFEYTGKQRVEWAIVDPDGTMPLDINRLNNSRMREAGTRGIIRISSRWGFWFQNLLYFLTGF